ncbi:hypothetical protein HN592_01820 [Candidatus Woesearchaeota archaeon]|jgi:hypothetical protein|nr:hypothetical protein [Candidatus Woesearchaeota archaeon]MBT4368580.1 hypothetical protein [Candidatus Woesearchaeota archaeon]MBT4713111.1 hypothetical protein [Candidatus Woesearchaeota archaeon]MBT6639033.1 hypothetical protein [Candidatus Woesearchaeota archaeon]MBT7134232.1 hypothetical protein [Candidatus Woesearchaeota archaeon]
MDLKQIKELNEMTKTLQKHGLANNSEEGVKLAEGISDADVPEKDVKSSVSKEYVEIMFERNNRKISEYVSSLKDEITTLKNKVDLLEQSIPSHKNYTSEPEKIEIKDDAKPVVEEAKPAVQETLSKDDTRDNKITKDDVKNGRDPDELDGADVSVENIFYYGNK